MLKKSCYTNGLFFAIFRL